MHAHNLSALEQELTADGWVVYSQAYVDPSDIPGRVDRGGYDIVLTAPDGTTHQGRGPTRASSHAHCLRHRRPAASGGTHIDLAGREEHSFRLARVGLQVISQADLARRHRPATDRAG